MNKRNGLPGADAADVFEQKIGRTDMQELEKILEEIDKEIAKERAICEDLEDTPGWKLYEKTMNRAKDIIRKHMNDGWIPVEDRLPENTDEMEVTLSNEDVTSAWYNRASRKWLVETRDKDGEDVKVIAWKSHSDPYRPEKGAEKD